MKKEKDKVWWAPKDKLKRKREWVLYKSKNFSIRLILDSTEQVEAFPRLGLAGVGVRVVKRSLFRRVVFWFARRKFKDLTIDELKQLSSADQKKYLDRKYYLHGIVPFLK